jgi:hypothetical protein
MKDQFFWNACMLRNGQIPQLPMDLKGRSFQGMDLEDWDFSGRDIRGCDFSDAQLTGTNFSQVTAGKFYRSNYAWSPLFGLLKNLHLVLFVIGLTAATAQALIMILAGISPGAGGAGILVAVGIGWLFSFLAASVVALIIGFPASLLGRFLGRVLPRRVVFISTLLLVGFAIAILLALFPSSPSNSERLSYVSGILANGNGWVILLALVTIPIFTLSGLISGSGLNQKHIEVTMTTDFQRACLELASFEGACLESVSFESASLRGANFKNAKIDKCQFKNTDLRDITGIELTADAFGQEQ